MQGQEIRRTAIRAQLTFLLTLCSILTIAQMETKGKEFYGTVNDSYASTDSVVIFISTEQACKASITIFSTGATSVFQIPANTLFRFAVDRPQVKTAVFKQSTRRGFKISTTKDVSAYLLVPAQYTTDATVLYPSKTIPKNSEYLLSAYTDHVWNLGGNSVVVSHEDFTIIEYTLIDTSIVSPKDTVFTDTLMIGECYQVRSFTHYDVSGGTVKVLNGKKVSAFCGNVCTNAVCGACDMLLEQVPPISSLGTNFLIAPLKGHSDGYIIQVTTNENNTVVFRDGTAVTTIDKGEVYEYEVTSERAVCIKTTNPALVSQVMKGILCNGSGTGDPGIVYISPMQQLIHTALVATANTSVINQHFISLVLPKVGLDSMYIDGKLLHRSKLTASNCGDFYWYTDTLAPGNHTLKNYNGFLAYIYGTGWAESYLYTAGSGLRNLTMDISYESYPLCDSGFVFDFRPTDTTSTYYKWFWDDGSAPDSGQNVTHTFYTDRKYLVKLAYAMKKNGLIDTSYQYVSLGDDGEIDLLPLKRWNACTDSSVNLSAFYVPGFNYLWNTGDTMPEIKVDADGVYSVVATDRVTGCVEKDTIEIAFFEKVETDFVINNLLLCSNSDIGMDEQVKINAKSDSILHYDWYVDFEFMKDGKSFIFSDAPPNNYDIELRVQSKNGCRDSLTKRIVVSDTPVVDIDLNIINKCLKYNQVRFNNISTVTFGEWDTSYFAFSNQDTVYSKEFTKQFLQPGNKWVELVVKTKQGCAGKKRYHFTIEPSPQYGLEVIDSVPCLNSNAFKFKSLSNDGIPSLYIWDWGDGSGDAYAVPESEQKKYSKSGDYQIELIVAHTGSGCSDTTYKGVSVIDQNPVAKIYLDSFNFCENKNFIRLSDSSDVPANQSYTLRWDYGDSSNVHTDSLFRQQFDSSGVYNIKLIVKTNVGCSDTAYKKFTVHPTNLANFKIDSFYDCLLGNYFTASNLNPLPNTRYRWERGDGTIMNGGSQSVAVNYNQPGEYRLFLKTETNLFACSDTFSQLLTVYPDVKAVFGLSDTSICISNNWFKAQDQTDYTGVLLNNQWLVNNSIIGKDTAQISFSLNDVGNHNIALISGYKSSCPDTISSPIDVAEMIELEILIDPEEHCLSENDFSFDINKISSHDSIVSVFWDLSESVKNSDRNTTMKYTEAGLKEVTLFVESKNGCLDTLFRSVTVHPQLNPSILTQDSSQCLLGNKFPYLYSPISDEDSIAIVQWFFDEGFESNQFYPASIEYTSQGEKQVKVLTTTVHGCLDSANLNVTVFSEPIARFMSDTVCYPDENTLRSNSYSEDEIAYHYWTVGGNDFIGSDVFKHALDKAGAVDGQLILETINGCRDTVSHIGNVVSMNSPVARFNFEIGTETNGRLPIYFADSSSVDATLRHWEFSDGQTSDQEKVTMHFTQSGLIDALLYVENEGGCSDTSHVQIEYNPPIKILVPSAFTPNGDLINDKFGPGLIERHEQFQMSVYNRWGEMVFQTDDSSDFWDGTYNKQKVQAGIYVYVIHYRTAKQFYRFKGTVTLQR